MIPALILTAATAWLLYRIWRVRPTPPTPGTAAQDRAALIAEGDAYNRMRAARRGDDQPGGPSAELTDCWAIWPDATPWPAKEDTP